ncbi:MAG: GtrA family protein, partial [Deltaproteobacteria bacterium]|nr:GtrA family protein [Deltaproteobacteria bacterium]
MALSLWLQWSYLLAQLVGIVLATMINFVANNLWTFAGSTSSEGDGPEGEGEGDVEAEVTPH